MADEKGKKPQPVKKDVHGGESKTTKKGPHGGGNKYFQMKPGKGFMVHDARPGGAGGQKGGNGKK